MLGFFPQCYPDELLYSVCARFSGRLIYPSKKALLHELFGTINAAAVIALPLHIDSLISRITHDSLFTSNRLIDRHSIFPLHSVFLSPQQVKQILKDMRASNGPAAYMRSGIMAARIPMPQWLRFCPICEPDDQRHFGETYWHRLHQIPGVLVCPTHNVFLEDSSCSNSAGRKHLEFVTAVNSTRRLPARHIVLSDPRH
jgi:hypothetical protein